MIVISGVLVLVALVLLVIGVVQEALPFVYTSIGVSLVSLLFLLVGILQRRKEPLPDASGSGSTASTSERPAVDVSDDATAVVPSSRRISADTPPPVAQPAPVVEEAPVAASVDEEPVVGGVVLVVSGRPRYHVDGCRYLSGKQAEEVDVLDARDEGFTPCGVCRPDEALADEVLDDEAFDDEVFDDEPVDDPTTSALPVAEPAVPVRPARRAAASRASAAASAREPAAAAPVARKVAQTRVPSEAPATRAVTAPAKRAAATKTAAPAKAPSRAAAAAADGTPAAATARRAGGVVVIPERGRFHRAECRYVRGVGGAEVLTKGQATKQGYEACGVCKP